MKLLLSILISYILGSIPSAYIVTKLKTGKDIREIGTKNMGTGNVFHYVGVKEGLLVLFMDLAKGGASVLIATHIFSLPMYLATISGFFAVLGHVYPIFLGFKGGRGAATTLGVQLTILFDYLKLKGVYLFLIILAIYLVFILITKSQVISLFFLFPIYPILFYLFTKDKAMLITNILFVVVVEMFGFKVFKRDFTNFLKEKTILKEKP